MVPRKAERFAMFSFLSTHSPVTRKPNKSKRKSRRCFNWPHTSPTSFVETKHNGHAKEFTEQLDISKYDGIVVLSGDGLLHEVLNGLMNRDDWMVAIRTPIGCIPAGSGNGLAHSIGNHDPLSGAITVIKRKTKPLDVWSVLLEPYDKEMTQSDVKYSFLSLTWGIVADIDIESDKLRWLGSLRFIVSGLLRIFFLKKYRGHLSYLSEEETSSSDDKCHFHCPCFEKKQKNEAETIIIKDRKDGKLKRVKWERQSSTIKEVEVITDICSQKRSDEKWDEVRDEFVYFLSTNTPLLTKEFKAAPSAHFSDGVMDLIYFKPDVTRKALLEMLSDTGVTGEYIKENHVIYKRVKKFLLIPDKCEESGQAEGQAEGQGVYSLDGELVPTLPVYVECHQGVANLICRGAGYFASHPPTPPITQKKKSSSWSVSHLIVLLLSVSVILLSWASLRLFD
eukprot:TRINITY_DN6641_c0_g1_i1.p1 TRINITY_DN6641_c0_g1~~TRINITY_DN6641_c0_g1_i1.p1  ORF type:complete len:451 (-),score=117.56 TRINITY_DN6641_c0_g1_i1:36-1388(-)